MIRRLRFLGSGDDSDIAGGGGPQRQLTRTLLMIAVVALSLAALVAVTIFLLGEFGDTEVRILLTTIAVAGFSLTGMASSMAFRLKPRGVAEAGLAVSAIGFVLVILLIWVDIDSSALARSFGTFIVLAVLFAFVALFLPRRPEHQGVASIRLLTIGLSAFVSAMIIALIVFDWNPGALYFRLLGSFAVLTVLGMLVVPILLRIAPSPVAADPGDDRGRVFAQPDLTIHYRGGSYAISLREHDGDTANPDVTVVDTSREQSIPIDLNVEIAGGEQRSTILANVVEQLIRNRDQQVNSAK